MSGQKAMILRTAEKLCIIASELGHATVDGQVDVLDSASLELNVFRSAMLRPKTAKR